MGRKELRFFISSAKVEADSAMAIAFAASRGESGAEEYERKAMTAGDGCLVRGFVALVAGRFRERLGDHAVAVIPKESGIELILRTGTEESARIEEEGEVLLHSAAVGYTTAAWERVTSPGEAREAEDFAERQVDALIRVLQSGRKGVARRQLCPF